MEARPQGENVVVGRSAANVSQVPTGPAENIAAHLHQLWRGPRQKHEVLCQDNALLHPVQCSSLGVQQAKRRHGQGAHGACGACGRLPVLQRRNEKLLVAFGGGKEEGVGEEKQRDRGADEREGGSFLSDSFFDYYC